MRKIINSTYISRDGVIEAPHTWPSTGPGDPAADSIQTELLLACDAVLMGRRTYESFAPVWPTRSGDPAGFGRLSHALMRHGLLDEPRDTTPLRSGTVILSYAAAS